MSTVREFIPGVADTSAVSEWWAGMTIVFFRFLNIVKNTTKLIDVLQPDRQVSAPELN